MDVILFEHDEFPIWVDISNNKISCVGFCLCCPIINKERSEQTLRDLDEEKTAD